MANIKAGWAECDITPEGKADLYGQYYHRPADGLHSRLSATVLALESCGRQAVMVSLDLALLQKDFQDELRQLVHSEIQDIQKENIFINTIHTHNAPAVDFIRGLSWLRELPDCISARDYRSFVLERVRGAVCAAWRNRQDAGIARAFGYARIGHCRRAVYENGTAEMYGNTCRDDFMGMEGGSDSGIELMFFFDQKKKPLGVILNVACPAQIMEATYKISGDFTGEIRTLLKKKFGSAFCTLGQISAAGCQSPRDLVRNYKTEPDFWHEDGVAEIGRRLFSTVTEVYQSALENIHSDPAFAHVVKNITLPKREASETEYTAAVKELARLEKIMPEKKAYEEFCADVKRNEKIAMNHGPYDSKLHHFVLIQNAKAVIARYETQNAEPDYRFEMHVLRIGDSVFVTNPFELYLEYGQQLKARSAAAQTFVIQLCGDYGGYLPGRLAEQLGGYGGLIINGVVGSEGGKKLVDEAVQTITEVFC